MNVTLTSSELEAKIRMRQEYKRMSEEAKDLADALDDEIKAAMTALGVDKLNVGEYKVTYVECRRESLDTKRLEADLGDLSGYKKSTTYKRFSVA